MLTGDRRRRTVRFGAMAAAVVLLATACGSGDDGGDTATGGTESTGGEATTTSVGHDHISPLLQDPVRPGAERILLRHGPIEIAPGQNHIVFEPLDLEYVEEPSADYLDQTGWITRIVMDIQRPDGSVPAVDVIHLHHGLLLNTSREQYSTGGGRNMFASGEEKTISNLPEGYAFRHDPDDELVLNHMIHNEFPIPDEVYVVLAVDFIPDGAPEAEGLRSVDPVWMDVQNNSVYPVFDALRGSGTDGVYTYPEPDSYGDGYERNKWTVDQDRTLAFGGGHVHPGGLNTKLWVNRGDERKLLFNSEAVYFTDDGPVSWDMAMTVTPPDWEIQVRAGDVLELTTDYDTSFASWYEGMGIMVLATAVGEGGVDPFESDDYPTTGEPSHGSLPENDNAGGEDTGIGNPADMPDGPFVDTIMIEDFVYEHGDVSESANEIPRVREGESITFDNSPDDLKWNGVWHTITSCALPCTNATGIAYPLADGPVVFDSGQLGTGGEPTANRTTWDTPSDLEPGTYAYWCRVHPFMRGAFRVVPADTPAG